MLLQRQVSAKLTSCTNEEMRVEISDNTDGICTASFVATQAGKATLSVFIGGQPIKGSPCSIIVSLKDYQKFSHRVKDISVQLEHYGRPSGIAFSSRDKRWAVADEVNNRVHVYFGSDHFQTIQHEHLCRPESIAFDDNNNLYVMNRSLHAQGGDYIHKFNTTTGRCLDSFGKYGRIDGQLDFPHGIAVHNDKVYVADPSNKRIVMYWKDHGNYKFKTIGQHELSNPYGVAVDSKENVLLVADSEKCGIVTFTLEGQHEGCLKGNKSFDTKNSKDASRISPQNIAIDADGLILVTSGSTVHVFDPVGNYISCFGPIPSNQDIAVSQNGSIYVSGEKNIQVWS